nr:MAG: DNA pilot protein [Microviridae sp.]
MCLYPKLIINRKYIRNKKNGGNVPICTDDRLKYVTAACGYCMECRRQKARQWQVRISEELRENPNAIFVTLTIDDENYKMLSKICNSKDENTIAKKAIRLWLERIRKTTKKSIKHWLVTELGHEATKRLHLHGIIWGENARAMCLEKWNYGFIYVGEYVNERTANYITKYMLKMDEENEEFQGMVFTSAGIGSGYLKRQDAENNKYTPEKSPTYRFKNGTKVNLPTYYRNKLMTEEEREMLWLEKLDKGIVYVCGEEINIDDEEGYNNLLEYHQKRGILLAGDNPQIWEKKKYNRRLKKQRTATIRARSSKRSSK